MGVLAIPKHGGVTVTHQRLLRLEVKTVLCTIVLLWVGTLVLYPLLLLLINSFKIGDGVFRPVEGYGFANWTAALSNPDLLSALGNTFLVVVIAQGIATPLAVLLAWLMARTDLPGKQWIDLAFWAAFFLPSLPVTLGYILLLGPKFGILNHVWVSIFGGTDGPFNIFSVAGIIWMHLATRTLVVKVILLRPILQNMDASLEETARVCGSSTFETILRIVTPLMAPAIVTVVLLGTIFGLESFEIEQVLGPPIGFFNFGTYIFRQISHEPPLFANATALGVLVLLIMVPLIIAQQWNARRRHYTTVTAHFKPQPFPLGRLKWPLFAVMMVLVALITAIPLSMLLLGTFMKMFGFFNVQGSPFTLSNWSVVLQDPIFLSSFRHTLILAFGAAGMAGFLYSLISYIIVKSKFWGRNILDFVSWLPITVPGVVLGLGLMWVFLGFPVLRILYGSRLALILAVSVTSMTVGVQLLKSNLLQISSELEEASWVAGASWWYTFRRVVLRLMAPTLIAVATLAFVAATRAVSQIAILTTNANRPLAMLQLDQMVDGRYESAAVVGAIIVAMTLGVALLTRQLGLNLGIRFH